jgi:hypothetical protein
MSTMVTEPIVQQRTLTAADRCDRCGAQAYVVFYNAETSPPSLLQFCKHHGDEHEPALLDKNFEATIDERQKLVDEVNAQKQLREG